MDSLQISTFCKSVVKLILGYFQEISQKRISPISIWDKDQEIMRLTYREELKKFRMKRNKSDRP